MKKQIIVSIVVLLLGIGIFSFYTKSKQLLEYCNQYSGFHSYAWGGGSEKCEQAGCRVEKIKEIDDPNIFDDEGFTYKCVSR